MASSSVYFRRRVGGEGLALYQEGRAGEDHRILTYTGKFRKSRKDYAADCGHKIKSGSLYFDARSASLTGIAIRYCKNCLDNAARVEWDFEDDLMEQDELMDALSDDDWSWT